MYASRSLTNASYKNGATRWSWPIIIFTFSFVFIISTKDENSSRNCSSSVCSVPAILLFNTFVVDCGTSACRLCSNSASGLSRALMSVFANPSVRRRSVTSTSRSPNTMSLPRLCPSLIATTNSSPDSNPAESNCLYIPLMLFPTAAAAAFMMGLLLLLGGDENDGRDDDDATDVLLPVSPDPPPPPPAAATAPVLLLTIWICGTMILDSLPSVETFDANTPDPGLRRFGSSSTKTPSGLVSLTSCPANSALSLDT
mmetsp:Transcript_34519/g.83307  ORF Transcript_34519/g.83307 Transcript_34519/m.83307 type:complete len:256 (-) Transcript_34519:805-1572(-)